MHAFFFPCHYILSSLEFHGVEDRVGLQLDFQNLVFIFGTPGCLVFTLGQNKGIGIYNLYFKSEGPLASHRVMFFSDSLQPV